MTILLSKLLKKVNLPLRFQTWPPDEWGPGDLQTSEPGQPHARGQRVHAQREVQHRDGGRGDDGVRHPEPGQAEDASDAWSAPGRPGPPQHRIHRGDLPQRDRDRRLPELRGLPRQQAEPGSDQRRERQPGEVPGHRPLVTSGSREQEYKCEDYRVKGGPRLRQWHSVTGHLSSGDFKFDHYAPAQHLVSKLTIFHQGPVTTLVIWY